MDMFRLFTDFFAASGRRHFFRLPSTVYLLPLLILLSASIFPLPAYAEEVSITASIDRNVIGLDEQAVLRIQISGSASNLPQPRLPDIPDFTFYSRGQSQNYSIINGQTSQSLTLNYAIAPKKTGKFTIPPVTLDYNGKTYQTSPIELEVTASAASAAAQAGSASAGQKKNLAVAASVDKSTVYVNQQVVFSFKFYRNINLMSNPEYYLPNFNGFWPEQTTLKNYHTSLDGQQYLCHEWSTVLFPSKTGSLVIGPGTLKVGIEDVSQNNDPFGDDFFRNFFGGGRVVQLQSKQVSLTVLPLPDEGKPRDFNGAVGQYNISASVDRSNITTSEAVSLSVTVSGTGNLKTVLEPKYTIPADFRKYETVSSLNTSIENGVLKGSKTFKTVLVPQTPGRKTIPPVSLSYFDPVQKRYRTETTKEIVLNVKQGAGAAAAVQMPLSSGGVKVLSSDIRYLKQAKKWKTASAPLHGSALFITFNVLPFLALAGSFVMVKWREKLSGDVAYARRLKASPVARKYLKKAHSLMSPDKSANFHAAISRALVEYIGNRANVSPDGLIFADIARILSSKGVKEESVSLFKSILDECDMARFAPAAVSVEMMNSVYDKAVDLIGKLEKNL